MTEGTPKAIEMKGITRNATKIGVQDGQAEDLINLRFMDGSWRANGNGRQIVNMPTGTIYQQLYVHTNIYHHLLGVDNGTLFWFAEIDNDGVTFYPFDGTSDRSLWPEDKQDLPTERVALTTVTGSMWITQTGHLLTIIDEADDFEHFVFKTSTKEYIEVNMDVNGKATDRSLYPFGQVHFNLYSDVNDSTLVHTKTIEELNLLPSPNSTRYLTGIHEISESNLKSDGFIDKDGETTVKQLYHNTMVELFGKATKANQFTRPFVAALACRLYDGSFLYASNPVLLYPRQVPTSQKHYVKTTLGATPTQEIVDVNNDTDVCTLYGGAHVFYQDARSSASTLVEVGTSCGCILGSEIISSSASRPSGYTNISQKGSYAIHPIQQEHVPVYCNGVSGYYTKSEFGPSPTIRTGGSKYRASVIGSKLCVSTDIAQFLEANKEIFQSLCIFITPQADLWSLESNKTDGRILVHLRSLLEDAAESEYSSKDSSSILTISYAPKKYDKDKVFYQLFHSPMYLLKEYNINQVQELEKSPIVDLTNFTDDNILENIALQKDTLPIEATSRTTYLPKVSYMYNGRLHIANYKSHPFFGYPIDLFHLHNHSVKVQDGAWFKVVLPNLADNNDAYLQYPKAQKAITNYDDLVRRGAPFFLVKVYIDTAQGEQIVCRYIPAYNPSEAPEHTANFIEDLNPLLTYPDARAKKMEIYYVNNYYAETREASTVPGTQIVIPAIYERDLGVYLKKKEFTLKPHPYLNMAYYIDPNLKPIKLSDFEDYREREVPI